MRFTTFRRFVAGYQDGNPKSPLICLGSGADGVAGVTGPLTNDVVAYALCRVVGIKINYCKMEVNCLKL